MLCEDIEAPRIGGRHRRFCAERRYVVMISNANPPWLLPELHHSQSRFDDPPARPRYLQEFDDIVSHGACRRMTHDFRDDFFTAPRPVAQTEDRRSADIQLHLAGRKNQNRRVALALAAVQSHARREVNARG
jgi:hypothetical protein